MHTKLKTPETKAPVSQPKDRVLDEQYAPSANFYHSDRILHEYLKKELSPEGLQYMKAKLVETGREAAGRMNELSLLADKHFPTLAKRTTWGEPLDEIQFHPAYWELMKIAVKTEMFTVKWNPELRKRFSKERNMLGFSTGFLYAMSEMGQYCPLCMTDGAARLLDRYAKKEDRDRLLQRIYTDNSGDFFTGAMFLTEKSGGSDVGANLVTADHVKDDIYLLNGEKWFCSNANADLIFALARTDSSIPGTKGLSIFLVEKHLPDGSRNPIEIIRIKDKLGVRSMASAECVLRNTVGKLLGEEFNGFNIMTDMINLSRIYTALGGLTGSRRALIEAYQFLNHRTTFRKTAIEHALVRDKLQELGSKYVANFYLVWRTIRALDNAENGNESEGELLRLITPMIKKHVSEESIYLARESMELMGGMGYIEDTVMPKIVRDLMVNPIWEGSGNIMVLDMLRASFKSKGLEVMFKEISGAMGKGNDYSWMGKELEDLRLFATKFSVLEKDELESSAKPFFEKLTSLYQLAVLASAQDDGNKDWIAPALDYLTRKFRDRDHQLRVSASLSTAEIEGLIGWE